MDNVTIQPSSETIRLLETLYGPFDLDAAGFPRKEWENRNVPEIALNRRLRWFWSPNCWLNKVRANRRMAKALVNCLDEIAARWDPLHAEKEGLDQYVRTYCFGCDGPPNPFWWGAGWRLSALVSGVALEEAIKVFTRHGFTWAGATDKKLIRDLYYL